LYGAETWALREVDQKYLDSLEMWCWRSTEKNGWVDRARNEEALSGVKEERNILHEVKRRNANWIGVILRRNCLLKDVVEGKIEVMRRRGRMRKQLLYGLKETGGCCKLKEEALDRAVWRTGF
jgi:hypothetical protein